MPDELEAYRRLQALVESRVRGVADPAMDRVLARTKAALIRDLHRCIAAIERLPVAKDRELALDPAS